MASASSNSATRSSSVFTDPTPGAAESPQSRHAPVVPSLSRPQMHRCALRLLPPTQCQSVPAPDPPDSPAVSPPAALSPPPAAASPVLESDRCSLIFLYYYT